jgi:osmotically inducible lipoprotein OsmB
MKNLILACALLFSVSILSGCSTSNRQDVGMVAGGVVGGVAGSALTSGSPVGAVAGAVGGAVVGRELSK